MDNLARREYDRNVDDKVKEELLVANIPVLRLPMMDSEVKTHYIGILNGFVFTRAWSYWVVSGYMPMKNAKYIYENYKDLLIRAGGHCGNKPPETQYCDPIYNEEIRKIFRLHPCKEAIELAKEVKENENNPKFVDVYHIDTQLGLCKLAKTIKDFDIYTEFIKE